MKVMSYEMKNILKIMIDNNEPHWSADTMDMARKELDRVYAQAAEYKEYRADTEKLYNALKAKGEKETQKYKVKFDEYEAKAKKFDEIKEEYENHKVATKVLVNTLKSKANKYEAKAKAFDNLVDVAYWHFERIHPDDDNGLQYESFYDDIRDEFKKLESGESDAKK